MLFIMNQALAFARRRIDSLTDQLTQLESYHSQERQTREEKQRVLSQAQRELQVEHNKVKHLESLCSQLEKSLTSTKQDLTVKVQRETGQVCAQIRAQIESIMGSLREEQAQHGIINRGIVETLGKELTQVKQERDDLLRDAHKWKTMLRYTQHFCEV